MAEVWPFVPLVKVRETYSWLTNIRRTPTSEMRESLRDPRLILGYDFHANAANDARAENLYRGNIAGDWLVPVWSEMTLFRTPVAAGASVLAANVAGDYRVGASVFLWSPGGWWTGLIAAVNANGITLGLPCPIPVHAVVPLRLAFITQGLGGSRLFNGATIRKITFSVRDPIDRPITTFPENRGVDVLEDATVITSPITTGLLQAREFIDSELGQVAVETRRDVIEGRSDLRFVDAGLAAMVARKRWFQSLRGRDRAFWLPTWASDLQLHAPIAAGDTWIDVLPLLGLPDALVGRDVRIEDAVGPLLRKVIVATDMGDFWRLDLIGLPDDATAGGSEVYLYIAMDGDLQEGDSSAFAMRKGAVATFLQRLKARHAATLRFSSAVNYYTGVSALNVMQHFRMTEVNFNTQITFAWQQIGLGTTWGEPDFQSLATTVVSFFASAPASAQKVFVLIADGGARGDPGTAAAGAAALDGVAGLARYVLNAVADPASQTALFDNTPVDGVPAYCDAEGLADALIATQARFELPLAIPRAVPATARVSWMMLSRLDTDTVTFETTGGISMETAVVVAEVSA